MKPGKGALLRHARRAFRQNLGRSMLIVAVIALPIGLAITVASAQRSLTVSGEQRAQWELGNASAVLLPRGDSASPIAGPASAGSGERDDAVTTRQLPVSADVLPISAGYFRIGRESARLVSTDMGHRLYAPTFRGLVGTVPRNDGEAAVSRPLAEREGLSLGDTWEVPGVGPRTVVATYVVSESKGSYAITLPLADAGLVRRVAGSSGFGPASNPQYLLTPAGEQVVPGLEGYVLQPVQHWSDDGEGAPLAVDKPPVLASFVSIGLLIEAGLVASAAYATGVRRRIRELGLLASIGATPSQVQRAVVSESVVVAAVAVPLGLVLGIAGSFATLPLVRRVAEHVVDGVGVRATDLIGPAIVGAVATVLAAWIPARLAGRVPVLTAMAGRVPSRALRGRAVPLGFAALGVGALGVFLSGELVRADGSESMAVILLALSILLTLGGAAAIGTWVMGRVAVKADRLPVLARLVARDGGRQQVRSAVVVGALVVVAAIPMAVGVLAATFDAQEEDSFVPAALLDEVWITQIQDGGFAVGPEPSLDAVPDDALERVAELADVQQQANFQVLGFELSEGAAVYWEATQAVYQGGTVALGTEEALAGLRLGESRSTVDRALRNGMVVGLFEGSVQGATLELQTGYPELERDQDLDRASYTDSVSAVEVEARPQTWAAPTYLMPEAVADDLGLIVVNQATVVVFEAPLTRDQGRAIEEAVDDQELFGQEQSPSYWVAVGSERVSVAKRVQWIAVAVALGIALLIGGCTTALAAAESDRDVLRRRPVVATQVPRAPVRVSRHGRDGPRATGGGAAAMGPVSGRAGRRGRPGVPNAAATGSDRRYPVGPRLADDGRGPPRPPPGKPPPLIAKVVGSVGIWLLLLLAVIMLGTCSRRS